MPSFRGISRGIAALEEGLAQVAALAMLAIMLVVVADVLGRYVFSTPLFFSYDLISMYLMVILFFFALSDTLHKHGHIAIDIFHDVIPKRLRFSAEAVGYGLSAIVIALIAWRLSERTATAYANDEVTATTVPWPLWLSNLPAALGSWVLAVRCVYRAIGYAASAATGEAKVELPPPPITDAIREHAV